MMHITTVVNTPESWDLLHSEAPMFNDSEVTRVDVQNAADRYNIEQVGCNYRRIA